MKNWKVVGFTITTYTMVIAAIIAVYMVNRNNSLTKELKSCISFKQSVLEQSDSSVLRINMKP